MISATMTCDCCGEPIDLKAMRVDVTSQMVNDNTLVYRADGGTGRNNYCVNCMKYFYRAIAAIPALREAELAEQGEKDA